MNDAEKIPKRSEDPIESEQKWELKLWHVLVFFCGIVILLWLYQAKLLNFHGALRQ